MLYKLVLVFVLFVLLQYFVRFLLAFKQIEVHKAEMVFDVRLGNC